MALGAVRRAAAPGGDSPSADRDALAELLRAVGSASARAPRGGRSPSCSSGRSPPSGYREHVLALDWGERRLANVHKLLRLARRFEASEGRDLRGFLDHVEHLEDPAISRRARRARGRRRARRRAADDASTPPRDSSFPSCAWPISGASRTPTPGPARRRRSRRAALGAPGRAARAIPALDYEAAAAEERRQRGSRGGGQDPLRRDDPRPRAAAAERRRRLRALAATAPGRRPRSPGSAGAGRAELPALAEAGAAACTSSPVGTGAGGARVRCRLSARRPAPARCCACRPPRRTRLRLRLGPAAVEGAPGSSRSERPHERQARSRHGRSPIGRASIPRGRRARPLAALSYTSLDRAGALRLPLLPRTGARHGRGSRRGARRGARRGLWRRARAGRSSTGCWRRSTSLAAAPTLAGDADDAARALRHARRARTSAPRSPR